MRLDKHLVEQGYTISRAKAQELIAAGKVYVNGAVVEKLSWEVPPQAVIEIHEEQQWVARSAKKLLYGLENWDIDVRGRRCLDVGSSTGGFTEVLLDRGAEKVIAVDVGTAQMVEPLRSDPRVELHEQTHIRDCVFFVEPESLDIIVCDVSFISLEKVLPVVLPLLKPNGCGVWLIKPQFEVGKEGIGKGGIVKNTLLHQGVCEKYREYFEEQGFQVELTESPLLGGSGNTEFLLFSRKRLV